jgi:hypothetical protein
MPSAGRLRAFSSARAFEPGINSRLRRGRIIAAIPLDQAPRDNISGFASKALFRIEAYG